MKSILVITLVVLIFTVAFTSQDKSRRGKKKCYKVYEVKRGRGRCHEVLDTRYTIDDCCNTQGAQAYRSKRRCRPCTTKNNWNHWGKWSKCDVICGKGFVQRRRKCRAPNDKGCYGDTSETKTCVNKAIPNCPVHGGWSTWGDWSECSNSCDQGKQIRFRSCTNPEPKYGGRQCHGTKEEVKQCEDMPPCPIHGEWGGWSNWAPCSVTCDVGYRARKRKCDNPPPKHNGRECDPSGGVNKESCDTYKECNGDPSASGSGSGEYSGSGSGDNMSGDDTIPSGTDAPKPNKRTVPTTSPTKKGNDFDFDAAGSQ